MHRQVLVDCWPYLSAIVLSVLAARVLLLFCATRLRLSHVWKLHRDQRGAVQSLSFVLTLPVFVMLMLFVVQLSQLTIGRMTVEFAAYAAARSAVVWIPADLGDITEGQNCLGTRLPRGVTRDDNAIHFDVYGLVGPSLKKDKIELAAAMALMPICPSSGTVTTNHWGAGSLRSLEKAYEAMSPASADNTRIPMRLQNKLAYALANTSVDLEIHHRVDEPTLDIQHDVRPYRDEFRLNEIGWEDQVLVTVKHDFALLPGPGRFLAKRLIAPGQTSDEVSSRIQRRGSVFVYPMTATVRLSNEGEKTVLPFIQFANTSIARVFP